MVCVAVAIGCGSQHEVDGVFSEADWAYLQTFRIDRLPAIDCPDGAPTCDDVARFGQQLFFDPSYAGPLQITSELGTAGETGKLACSSCHDPARYFTDSRRPNDVSLGTTWTRRNVPALVDVAQQRSFSWTGAYPTLTSVLDLALRAGLNTTHDAVVDAVLDHHLAAYNALFPDVAPPASSEVRDQIFANAALAITAYETKLVTGPSAFDRYLAGEGTLDDAAKRGARLFIGKALCSECHGGPLFSDGGFYVTGVEQRGEHVVAIDEGRALATGLPSDLGRFRTPSLRNVAQTAPYLHTGQRATLAEVIELYRWGGDPGGFSGTKDPRIVPLELTDEDVADLEAFLESLTGPIVDPTWATKPGA